MNVGHIIFQNGAKESKRDQKANGSMDSRSIGFSPHHVSRDLSPANKVNTAWKIAML